MQKRRLKTDGICCLCDEEVEGGKICSHLEKCRSGLVLDGDGKPVNMMHILVKAEHVPGYWLQIGVWDGAKLSVIDEFLRRVWLECCGHLSSFEIDGQRYEANLPGDDLFSYGPSGKSTNIKLYNILAEGSKFNYEYDFGSPTYLELEVLDIFPGSIPKQPVTLLAHNKKPEIPCESCGKNASNICSACQFDFLCFCDECAPEHECGEEMMMPLVNSPRTGVCGYCGPVPFDPSQAAESDRRAKKQSNRDGQQDKPRNIDFITEFILRPDLYTEKPCLPAGIVNKLWKKESKGTQMEARIKIEKYLEDSSEFVAILNDKDGEWYYHHLPTCFEGKEFCVKPTEEEIKEGILFPGHRFLPYISMHQHPADIKLFDNNSLIKTKTVKKRLDDLWIYHTLLGQMGAIDYFVTDHHENIPDLDRPLGQDDKFKLTVMNMKKFYRKHDFKLGDSIIMKVEDFVGGTLSMQYCPEAKLAEDKGKIVKWCALFAEGIEKAIADNNSDMTIEEELATALIYHGNYLLNNPVIHLGGWLAFSDKFAIKPLGEEAIIWYQDQEPEFNEENRFADIDFDDLIDHMEEDMFEAPDENDFDGILKYMGFDIIPEEIEGYMRDELYHQGNSPDQVWQRCFDERIDEEPEFLQYEQPLKNHFSQLWKRVSGSYNRFSDGKKGEIRKKALKIKDKQIVWMRDLSHKIHDFSQLQNSGFVELAQFSGMITQMIIMLNDPDDEIPAKEFKKLSKALESASAMIDKMQQNLEQEF